MESARLPWKSFYFGGKTMLVYPGIERDIYNKQKMRNSSPSRKREEKIGKRTASEAVPENATSKAGLVSGRGVL